MSEIKRPLKVFLCHAHADRDPVHAFYIRLVKDGVDAWLDKEKLLPGQDWELEIRKAVREADVVVVCLSKQFNEAGFRQKEVRLALDTAMEKPEGEIFIIPARLEECDNLESLKKWHWVDLFEEDGYAKFLRALRVRGDRIGAITYSLIRFDAKAEKERKIKFLLEQAGKLEEDAKWADALEIQRQIKKINSSTPGVDGKISELQRKTQANDLTVNIQRTAGKKGNSTKKTVPWLPVAAVGIFAFCCLMSVIGAGWYSQSIGFTDALSTPINESIDNLPIETTALPPAVQPSASLETATIDEMVLVPAGEFTMGSDLKSPVEAPPHTVLLDAFYMDIYETTTSQYQECVTAGFCARPWTDASATRSSYFSNPEFADYPVIHVDWNMANTYCEWRGKRLPTEAEWEKAARGQEGLIYPWGNEFDGSRLNFCDVNCLNFPNTDYDDGYNDTAPVDAYPLGVSVFGIYNLAGNVREWVADEYNVYPGGNPAAASDFGLGLRVVRGGSWNENYIDAQSFHRFAYAPDAVGDNTGFRCAMNVP